MSRQRGHAILLTSVVLIGACLIGASAAASRYLLRERQQEALYSQAQSLSLSMDALESFSALQGHNSHTHVGHLPCPAAVPNGPPQTVCLNALAGYLPIQSVSKVNYLNIGLSTAWPVMASAGAPTWHYAVSPKLVQPNTLGWGQWVNESAPALWLETPQGDTREAMAVVAERLETMAPNTVRAHGQYAMLAPETWQRQREQTALSMATHQLMRWGHPIEQWLPQENLRLQQGQWMAVRSDCECRCTSTRCSCTCSSPGVWESAHPCATGSAACTPRPAGGGSPASGWTCTNTATEACVFQGPAGLLSAWPVSQYEPPAAINKSCQPAIPHLCPTSAQAGNACICRFSWPTASLPWIDRIKVKASSASGWQLEMQP